MTFFHVFLLFWGAYLLFPSFFLKMLNNELYPALFLFYQILNIFKKRGIYKEIWLDRFLNFLGKKISWANLWVGDANKLKAQLFADTFHGCYFSLVFFSDYDERVEFHGWSVIFYDFLSPSIRDLSFHLMERIRFKIIRVDIWWIKITTILLHVQLLSPSTCKGVNPVLDHNRVLVIQKLEKKIL